MISHENRNGWAATKKKKKAQTTLRAEAMAQKTKSDDGVVGKRLSQYCWNLLPQNENIM